MRHTQGTNIEALRKLRCCACAGAEPPGDQRNLKAAQSRRDCEGRQVIKESGWLEANRPRPQGPVGIERKRA